jgi:hypothetical protein
VLFKRSHQDRIATGEITVTYRRWSRPQARASGRYRLGAGGVIEVEAVDLVAPASITDADAQRSGCTTRAELIEELTRDKPLATSERVYRVEFRYVAEPDKRATLDDDDRLSDDDIATLRRKLDRMDAASADGPWTRDVLRLIADNPHVVSTELASRLGRERFAFKADVRKLKNLGLTRSFEVGYELSPRGRKLLESLEKR